METIWARRGARAEFIQYFEGVREEAAIAGDLLSQPPAISPAERRAARQRACCASLLSVTAALALISAAFSLRVALTSLVYGSDALLIYVAALLHTKQDLTNVLPTVQVGEMCSRTLERVRVVLEPDRSISL